MPQPVAIDAIEQPLIQAYRNAWLRVLAEEQQLAADPIRFARKRRLAEVRARIEADMDDLDGLSRVWIQKQLPQVYAMGAATGVAEATGGTAEFVWTQINQEAVQRLATTIFHELLGATSHVRATTKQLIREVARDEALQSAIEGRTARQAADSMRKLLESKNIFAVRYADGSKHGLAEYSRMAMRTTTATAYNLGTLDGAASQGVKYWQVFDGPNCGWSAHDSGQLANGKIVTQDEARSFPISHPNCRRAFGARPDITTQKQAKAESRLKPVEQPQTAPAPSARQQRVSARKTSREGRDAQRQARIAAQQAKAGRVAPASPVEAIEANTGMPSVGELINKGYTPDEAIAMVNHVQDSDYAGFKGVWGGDIATNPDIEGGIFVPDGDYLADKRFSKRSFDVGDLYAGQDVPLATDNVAALAKNGITFDPMEPPIVAHVNGVDVLLDGHHRAAAAALRGEKLDVVYIDLGKVDGLPPIPTATPAAKKSFTKSLIDEDAKLPASAQPTVLYDSVGNPGDLTHGAGRVYDGRWWTNIGQDTTPGTHIPVQGVTVQKHTIQNGIAIRRNGRSYLLEIEPGQAATAADLARLEETVKQVEGVFKDLPPKIAGHQRAITITKANNPADAHWAQVYNKPGFKSAATGGDGNTVFWNSPVKPGIVMHELGHNIDAGSGINGRWFTDDGANGVPSIWKNGQGSDNATSFYAKTVGTKTTIYGGHSITPGAQGVTEYGAENIREDFAEAVRLYLTDRHNGYVGYVGSDSVRFVDLFPERARALDQLFGFQPVPTTPYQLKRIEEATAGIAAQAHNAASLTAMHNLTLMEKYGLSAQNIAKAKAAVLQQLTEKAEAEAKAAIASAAAKAAVQQVAVPKPTILAADISFADKTGIGVKAANAKKAALKNGASVEEAKAIFNETKAKLTAEKLAELNGIEVATQQMAKQQVVALTHAQVSGIGAKAGNAKKAALQAGKSADEAQAIFIATKQQLTAQMLAELNGTGVQVVQQAKATQVAGVMKPGRKPSKASAYLKDAGSTNHPKAKMRNGGHDAQAKSNIAAELGSRMNNPEDWQVFREYSARVYAKDPGPFDAPDVNFASGARYSVNSPATKGLTDPEDVRQWILDSEAAARVQQWAGTSGDKTVAATAMQQAVKEEFGTTGSAIVRAETDLAFVQQHDEFYGKVSTFYRRFVRRMYEHTQDDLAANGITSISVDRGMNFHGPNRPDWATVGTQTRPDLQPANSWSTSKAVAHRFGSGQGQIRISAVIPADRVLGSARTGFGCYSEKEFVVLVSDGLADISTF